MRVLITGVDGYLGWSLAQYLTVQGHDVAGADGFLRRRWVEEIGSWSATPIPPMEARLHAFARRYGKPLPFWDGNLRDYAHVEQMVQMFEPDAIVHFGECPSAPYSMIDVHHATFVQVNNVTTTLNLIFAIQAINPSIHLVKLGTMGEYGTPNLDIPEGFFDVEYRGRRDRLPFPRQAGSWYHWSKVHGSNNLMLACKIWGMRVTDIMQGVVFGLHTPETGGDDGLLSRFDFDPYFGTVINRYCAQAVIGHPLTPYGTGRQRRGFLPLRDSMQCLLLTLEHPPQAGEYRVLNQFENIYEIQDLASKVQELASTLGLSAEIRNVENPRLESENHYYNPDHQVLFDLGYRPSEDIDGDICSMLETLATYRERIEARRHILIPDQRWDGQRRRANFLSGDNDRVEHDRTEDMLQ